LPLNKKTKNIFKHPHAAAAKQQAELDFAIILVVLSLVAAAKGNCC
jgi:hypothetical protein